MQTGQPQAHQHAQPNAGRVRLFRWLVPISVFLLLYLPIDLGVGRLKSRRKPSSNEVAPDALRVPSEFFHHGLRPLGDGNDPWGQVRYRLCANSMGFKDESPRQVSLRPLGRRILFIGDSFTEGIGVEFRQTFAGRVGSVLERQGIEVLNAGAVSYSPKLMFLKLEHLIKDGGLHFDELAIFIDCSDAIDEVEYGAFRREDLRSRDMVPPGIDFREIGRGEDRWYECSLLYREILRRLGGDDPWKRAITFENAATGRRFVYRGERSDWTFRQDLFDAWAGEGLTSAAFYIDKILDLGRVHGFTVSIAIYPWPAELRAGVQGSKNVAFWRSFCDARSVPLVDLYVAFAGRGEAERTIRELFIEGDSHWNEAGHRLVAGEWLSQRSRFEGLAHIRAPDSDR